MAIKISGISVIDDNRRTLNTRLTTVVVTANTSATAGNNYFLNGAGIVVTLPSTPTAGDQVGISEVEGDTTSSVARNGSKIMSLDEDLTIDNAYGVFKLTYVDATEGWVFA